MADAPGTAATSTTSTVHITVADSSAVSVVVKEEIQDTDDPLCDNSQEEGSVFGRSHLCGKTNRIEFFFSNFNEKT